MASVNDRLRAFFADSTPTGRLRAILAMVGLGVFLVVLLVVAYRLGCSWPRIAGTVCVAMASNPPWTLITSVATAPSLLLLWLWRTQHKDADLQLARREERSKRFIDGVRMLSDERLEARLGGIYSLESLVIDATEERPRVTETLCAFLRTHGQKCPDDSPETEWRQAEDVQAAFYVVTRVPVEIGIDLRHAQLPRIDGATANLSSARLDHANLSGANLEYANLFGASLKRTNLRYANLCRADLAGAVLDEADIRGAHMFEANVKTLMENVERTGGLSFKRTVLYWAQLERAIRDRHTVLPMKPPTPDAETRQQWAETENSTTELANTERVKSESD